jgi:hypothetical protein
MSILEGWGGGVVVMDFRTICRPLGYVIIVVAWQLHGVMQLVPGPEGWPARHDGEEQTAHQVLNMW